MRRYLMIALVTLLALSIWYILSDVIKVPNYVLPSPKAVASNLIENYPLLIKHAIPTLEEILVGFAIATALGIAFGIMIVAYSVIRETIYPVLLALNILPKLTLMPLFLLWFGYGTLSKIAINVLLSFFPIALGTISGMKDTDKTLLRVMDTLGASKWQKIFQVMLPSALPNIFMGLKLSVMLSVTGAIIGEFMSSKEGLGFLMIQANFLFNLPLLFSALITASVIGVALYTIVDKLGKRMIFWKN